MNTSFDIVVLGSGIAGSSLALVLAQAGLRTLVVERKSHPRFVIGESTLPTTTFLLNQLARDYDVPELAQVAHYLTLRENGCAAWPKQGFWYGLHHEGRPLEPRHEHMFETLLLPNGPDVHMLRADADAFLVSRFAKYRVEYEDNTEMLDFERSGAGVELRLRGPSGEHRVSARYIVDATGHASFFAKRFGLRDETPRLATNTRSIFAHYEDVPPLDERLGGCNSAFRFRRDATTMHHCFRGGWIWVIPFDTGVTSVGFQLDRDAYPLDERVPPEAEIAQLLERYPSVRAHLGAMKPIRPVIRTDRVQFTSRSILGDGFILAPHAAGFIEPLFSTGILLTASFISRFVPAAQRAQRAGDFSAEQFRPIERAFLAEVEQIDKLVDGVIQSFRNYDLFKQYWRNWIIGTVAQFSTCILTGRAPQERPVLYGAGIPEFRDHLFAAHALVRRAPGDDLALAAEIKARTDPWWQRLTQPVLWTSGDWSIGSPEGTGVHGANQRETTTEWLEALSRSLLPVEPDVSFSNARTWLEHGGKKMEQQLERYHRSRREGGDFHLAYERILANQNPDRFDYRENLGLKP
ncbi:MAG TPA: NAD(P)/FAD-dependent oxidoreductase [Polyangia bacterium]|nr:NAD(P)/FAD-dependent oxidoreductase [Polyangia bacterium]